MADEITGGDAERTRSPCGCGAATSTGGEFTDYVMPAQEGEVVLDVIHRVQATQAPDLACRWNCKAGQVRIVLGRDQRPARPHVHDPDGHAPGRARRSPSRRCGPSPSSGTWSPTSPTTTRWPSGSRRSAPGEDGRRGRGRRLPHGSRSTSSGARSSASASSATCARTCATSSATTRRTRPPSPARASSPARPSSRCTRSTPTTGASCSRGAGPRQVQHHQVLHRGVPRAHQDHRQRHHPAEGAGGRRLLRPGGLAGPQDPSTAPSAPPAEAAAEPPGHRARRRAARRSRSTASPARRARTAGPTSARAGRGRRRYGGRRRPAGGRLGHREGDRHPSDTPIG